MIQEPKPMSRLLLALATLAFAAGCGSSRPQGTVFPPLPPGVEFADSVHYQVQLRAYFPRSADSFSFADKPKKKLNFARTQGLIPIGIRIGLRSGASEGLTMVTKDDSKIRLYLPDGTVLARKSVERITADAGKSEGDEIRALSLKFDELGSVNDEGELKYVFFEGPEGFEWDGERHRIFYSAGGYSYDAALEQTMISLDISTGQMGAQTLNAGVRFND